MSNRISVSAVSSWQWSFDHDLAFWQWAGIGHVGLSLRKCDEVGLERAVERVRAAGLRVSNFVECGSDPARWVAAADTLADLGGGALVLTTGPGFALDWNASVDRLSAALAPLQSHRGAVAIENTGPLRVDLSFVLTLRDTVDVAELLECSVCVEINSCWAERDLAATLRRAGDRIAHVQISDWKIGSHCTPDRVVPGDGDIPLARVLRHLHAAGYAGAYEIELVGPQIEAEGYESAIVRAIERVKALLTETEGPSP